MRRGDFVDKPQFILDFEKPKNTELKCIKGKWYLYQCSSKYDPETKRARKRSGTYLGRVTENGFIPKRAHCSMPVTADVLEIGATQFCWDRTESMRSELKKRFPDIWEQVYVIAVLRALGEVRLHRIQLAYEDSFLCVVMPDLALSAASITRLLQSLGKRRDAIAAYMRAGIEEHDDFILVDGHRLLSASKGVELAEVGYDSKRRFKPQINLVYAFTKSAWIGKPSYYEQYSGGTVDVVAFRDMLRHAGILPHSSIIAADKGFGAADVFKMLSDEEMWYCVALKRGNRFVKDKIPARDEYETVFTYRQRPIYAKTFKEDGFLIFLYLDEHLHADELASLTERIEKANARTREKYTAEKKRRDEGKRRMSDEAFDKLKELNPAQVAAGRKEMGTITLRTNKTDLTAREGYEIYKQRQCIEEFFKVYNCTLGFDASYMQNDTSMEAWLFLNHLGACIAIDALEELAVRGCTSLASWDDLRSYLQRIRAVRSGDKWHVTAVKKSVHKFIEKLDMSTEDMTLLNVPSPRHIT